MRYKITTNKDTVKLLLAIALIASVVGVAKAGTFVGPNAAPPFTLPAPVLQEQSVQTKSGGLSVGALSATGVSAYPESLKINNTLNVKGSFYFLTPWGSSNLSKAVFNDDVHVLGSGSTTGQVNFGLAAGAKKNITIDNMLVTGNADLGTYVSVNDTTSYERIGVQADKLVAPNTVVCADTSGKLYQCMPQFKLTFATPPVHQPTIKTSDNTNPAYVIPITAYVGAGLPANQLNGLEDVAQWSDAGAGGSFVYKSSTPTSKTVEYNPPGCQTNPCTNADAKAITISAKNKQSQPVTSVATVYLDHGELLNPGSPWVAPISKATIQIWGGGGGGGGGVDLAYAGCAVSNNNLGRGGGGGAGGYQLITNMPLNVGQGYSYTLGSGGNPGYKGAKDKTSGSDGSPGTDTVFGAYVAKGGMGGKGSGISQTFCEFNDGIPGSNGANTGGWLGYTPSSGQNPGTVGLGPIFGANYADGGTGGNINGDGVGGVQGYIKINW